MNLPLELLMAKGLSHLEFLDLAEAHASIDHLYTENMDTPQTRFVFLKFFFVVVVMFAPVLAFATGTTVKIAVLDNLQSEKLATARYIQDYKDGLELGKNVASLAKINFEFKYFLFQNKDMAPEIAKIKNWLPDVVIGPRSSEFFILLKNQFKDIAVISPFATAAAVSSLPPNFYSLSPDNTETVDMLVDFVKTKFPGRRVFQIVQTDCGNCMDSSEQFTRSAAKLDLITAAKPSYLFADQAETIPMEKLLTGYKSNDIIFLPNTSYVSGALAGRIANHLKLPKLTFLGCTGWGDWKVGNFGKFPSPFDYEGFRIVSWSVHFQDAETQRFQSLFKKLNGSNAEVNVTRINFAIMDGLTQLIVKMDSAHKKINQESILKEFLKLRSTVKNPWRPTQYGVFKVTQQGEVLEQP